MIKIKPIETCSVILTSCGNSRISTIKEVKAITGLGLREAFDLVNTTPHIVKTGISQRAATSIATRLKRVGASVKVTADKKG
jgi:large subunit ribosomal protein L7/L12